MCSTRSEPSGVASFSRPKTAEVSNACEEGQMSHFESAVEIERAVEDVYSWFLDMDKNAPRIDPEADEARKEPQGETKAGTTFYLRSGGRESPVTYTDLAQNKWIDFVTKIGPMRPTARLSFEPMDSGTRLSIRAQSNMPTLLKPFERLANRMGKREWDGRLDRIRADLEANE